jgi:hypothetical protein
MEHGDDSQIPSSVNDSKERFLHDAPNVGQPRFPPLVYGNSSFLPSMPII